MQVVSPTGSKARVGGITSMTDSIEAIDSHCIVVAQLVARCARALDCWGNREARWQDRFHTSACST
jgi:hypothetical protein